MRNFQLTEYRHLKGIGAASGLIYLKDFIFLISDNSTFLYQYDLDNDLLLKIPLVNKAKENIEKKEKLDLEAITCLDNQLYLFGSGSTKKRSVMFSLDWTSNKVERKDVTQLYAFLTEIAQLEKEELNIEGAICVHQKMYLFQRGNGKNSKNGIFIIPENLVHPIQYLPIRLPFLNNIETTFTDAILVENDIYFLATAEDTDSTYEDGQILGSIIGKINGHTFELEEVLVISENKKFEGLTLFLNDSDTITFLLCEDNDTETLESILYKLVIEK